MSLLNGLLFVYCCLARGFSASNLNFDLLAMVVNKASFVFEKLILNLNSKHDDTIDVSETQSIVSLISLVAHFISSYGL